MKYVNETIDLYELRIKASRSKAHTKFVVYHLKTLRTVIAALGLPDELSAWHEEMFLQTLLYLQEGRGHQQLGQTSLSQFVGVARRMFAVAIEQGALEQNPVGKLRIKPAEARTQAIGKSLLTELFSHLQANTDLVTQRDLLICAMAVETGGRIMEILGMLETEVNDTNTQTTCVLGKGKKRRPIPISPTLRKLIAHYNAAVRPWFRPQSHHLFLTIKGEPMTYSAFNTRLIKYGKILGIKIDSHQFRATFATTHYKQHQSERRLRRALGHSTLDMTHHYIDDAKSDEAVTALEGHSLLDSLQLLDSNHANDNNPINNLTKGNDNDDPLGNNPVDDKTGV